MRREGGREEGREGGVVGREQLQQVIHNNIPLQQNNIISLIS